MATTYTTSPVGITQVPGAVTEQHPHPATRYRNIFMALGLSQLIIGVICLIFGIILFVFLSIYYIGSGIWGGIWYIIIGSLGISIAQNPNSCNTIAGLVVSIIGSILALVHGILDALGAVAWSVVLTEANSRGVIVGLYGTTTFLAFVMLVLAIIHAAFCGMAGCSGYNMQGQVVGTTTVVTMPTIQQGYGQQQYYPQPTGVPTVYTNVQAQQQQPPPTYNPPPQTEKM